MEMMRDQTVHRFEETSSERDFRKDCGFPDIESKMPSLSSRHASTFVDNITSYMGKKNPFIHPVNEKDHTVWLFDNTAYQPEEGGPWKVDVGAAYFLRLSGKDESKIIASVAEALGLAEDEEAKKTITKRLRPLMDTVLPAHTVQLALGGKEEHVQRLGPSDRDGISNDIVHFHGNFADGDCLTSHAVGIQTATPLTTTFATTHGWAVISDIDDTIKKTMTSSPLGILRTTFVEDPVPIGGMPELYAQIKKDLHNPPFWYLSASPYNLYPFLRQFREDNYPPGTMVLREASWMNLAGWVDNRTYQRVLSLIIDRFLTSLTQGTQAYKVSRMETIQKNFPSRKFLCIGDSTQSDPEAYGEMYRNFPGWVGAVFIRLVRDVEPMNESEKNKPERFKKAFKDVPRDVWTVFEDPKELVEKVRELGGMGI